MCVFSLVLLHGIADVWLPPVYCLVPTASKCTSGFGVCVWLWLCLCVFVFLLFVFVVVIFMFCFACIFITLLLVVGARFVQSCFDCAHWWHLKSGNSSCNDNNHAHTNTQCVWKLIMLHFHATNVMQALHKYICVCVCSFFFVYALLFRFRKQLWGYLIAVTSCYLPLLFALFLCVCFLG